jgi:hypothetical protein
MLNFGKGGDGIGGNLRSARLTLLEDRLRMLEVESDFHFVLTIWIVPTVPRDLALRGGISTEPIQRHEFVAFGPEG